MSRCRTMAAVVAKRSAGRSTVLGLVGQDDPLQVVVAIQHRAGPSQSAGQADHGVRQELPAVLDARPQFGSVDLGLRELLRGLAVGTQHQDQLADAPLADPTLGSLRPQVTRGTPLAAPAPQPTPLIPSHGLSNASPAARMRSRTSEFRNRH